MSGRGWGQELRFKIIRMPSSGGAPIFPGSNHITTNKLQGSPSRVPPKAPRAEAFVDFIGARGVRSDHDFVNTLACELEAEGVKGCRA